MRSDVRQQIKGQEGFLLMELALVLSVLGIVLAGSMTFMHTTTKTEKVMRTKRQQEIVMQALIAHLGRTGYLPLPEKPLFHRGPSDTTNINAKTLFCGIVPFRALGLSQDEAKDGHGHWMTYSVDPRMTIQGQVSRESVGSLICSQPSQLDIQEGNTPSVSALLSQVPRPSQERLLPNSLPSQPFGPLYPDILDPLHPGVIANSMDAGQAGPISHGKPVQYDGIAVILISHGPRGYGAFSDNFQRIPCQDNASECKRKNCQDTLLWCAKPEERDKGHFDDSVMWKTRMTMLFQAGFTIADIGFPRSHTFSGHSSKSSLPMNPKPRDEPPQDKKAKAPFPLRVKQPYPASLPIMNHLDGQAQ